MTIYASRLRPIPTFVSFRVFSGQKLRFPLRPRLHAHPRNPGTKKTPERFLKTTPALISLHKRHAQRIACELLWVVFGSEPTHYPLLATSSVLSLKFFKKYPGGMAAKSHKNSKGACTVGGAYRRAGDQRSQDWQFFAPFCGQNSE